MSPADERQKREPRRGRGDLLERSAAAATRWAGSGPGFGIALATILVWAITGPLFGWSDTWQLVINTGTTIVTFLMVFLIQRTQNKDGMAIQLKLNEVVAAIEGASNRLIDVEDLTEHELKILHEHFRRLAEMARLDGDIFSSHSIDEARMRHESKRERRQGGGTKTAQGKGAKK
ncbi:MAG TPA: low affinity iron permease family protein [Vicinamibacterales bacterium]